MWTRVNAHFVTCVKCGWAGCAYGDGETAAGIFNNAMYLRGIFAVFFMPVLPAVFLFVVAESLTGSFGRERVVAVFAVFGVVGHIATLRLLKYRFNSLPTHSPTGTGTPFTICR